MHITVDLKNAITKITGTLSPQAEHSITRHAWQVSLLVARTLNLAEIEILNCRVIRTEALPAELKKKYDLEWVAMAIRLTLQRPHKKFIDLPLVSFLHKDPCLFFRKKIYTTPGELAPDLSGFLHQIMLACGEH